MKGFSSDFSTSAGAGAKGLHQGHHHEKNISTVGYSPQAHARLSGQDENAWWAGRHPCPPCQRAQASRGISTPCASLGGVVQRQAEQGPVHKAVRVNAAGLLRSRPVASSRHFGLQRQALEGSGGSVLLMSVPRRVLKRAIDRNTVRRIARESLRQVRGPAEGVALMVRLKRRPDDFEGLSQRARKTLWRSELDQLFAAGLVRA